MRITQRAVTLTSLQGLNRNLDSLAKLQQQLTSGKAISRPSDSPTGTNSAMQTRAEQATVAQQNRNVTDAKAWLEQGSSTLMEMMEVTQRIRNLTLQGLNGSASETSREALATEVASLRDGLLNMANTKVMGRPLFGGVTAGQIAYDPAGTFVGDDRGEVLRRVSDSELLRVDISGPQAFGTGADNLFVVVGRIADDLINDPGNLDTDLAALDAAFKTMQSAVADVGARGSRLEQAEQVNLDRELVLRTQLDAVEGIDLPKTIMDVQMKQMGYEAALAATAKAISPTLLDYLR
ncbi:flagellar hook-associated protein FlgL [Blastococcus sp. CCUG 61487]|uniref:flagellar hook-associated protein FlgL n=1 Tax=Blastococcus sp. CCUG 61487 TaxID=1840703 RepID=UPI0010BFA54E|nr:flagellar hook-associated protein FlgL [Blastococcus sp. CCUG 61487]TKJ21485.1 flagellar hook protein [Blastococcus sp. CCUG 61487]